MNRADFQQLSKLRIAEAKTLLDGGHDAGAYYLAGYAVECALKACIAKLTRRYDYPPDGKYISNHVYTHDLEKLMAAANLLSLFQADMRKDPTLERHWGLVKQWKESARYEPNITAPTARDTYTAITDRKHGVLSWLKKHW
jgi:HEPN domain-containing protein